ncbi:hypothetical protein VPHD51_0066 [Vibrio phage D51]
MQTSILLMYCLGATLNANGTIETCKDQGKIPMPSVEVCEDAGHEAIMHGMKAGFETNKAFCILVQEI